MWRCQYCETFNRDDAVICEVCGNSKGTQAKMPETVPAENTQSHVILDQQPAAGYAEAPVQQPEPAYQPESVPPVTPVPPVPPQPAEEPAAPRKKRGWVIWLVVILVVLIGGGTASWFIFEEEIRTFIADFTGGDEAETGNNDISQEGIPSLPTAGDAAASEPTEAPTANTNVFNMGGGFMNNNAEATAEVTAEPTGAPTIPADYVPPQSINAQSPVEDIVYIQSRLCELGLLNEGEYTHGLYDTATATGVINFQRLINNERGYTVLAENGECDALTISYVELYMNSDHTPVVNYVRYSVDVAMKDEPLTITVSSNIEADTLIMYREKGNVVDTWPVKYSQVSGNERIWNVEYTFIGAGKRGISFAVSNDGGVSVGVSTDAYIDVASPAPLVPPSVSSVEYNITDAVLGEPVVITVKTNAEANYLVMYSEDGKAPGKWSTDGNSSVDGAVRTWSVEFEFNGVGTRSLEFAASNDGGNSVGEHFAAPAIKISAVNVNKAEALQSVAYCNENVSISVRSDAKARYLHMYDASMNHIATWEADKASKVEGTDRVWTVSSSFTASGSQKLIFAASFDNENTGAAAEVSVMIAGNAPEIVSAAFSATSALVGEPVDITVKTNADAVKLIMRSEKGDAAKTWEASNVNSTVNGTERIWKVSYPFITAGSRTMTFYAERADGTSGKGREAAIEIITIPAKITGVTADKPTAAIGEEITFTVESNVNADNLVMYSEDGKAIWNWKADKNSTVNGDKRVWNVKYSFKGNGNRKMSFVVENAYDGETSQAVPVTVSIVPVEVTAAAFINSVAYCEEYVSITVITDASARHLHMYKEDMKEVTTWDDPDKFSTVNGLKRTWNVSYKFATEGIRSMCFAASYDGKNPGKPCEPKQITIAKDQPGVGFIHCDKEEANRGDRIIITVKTNADANMLIMKDEGGNVVTSWSAETEGISVINGTERIWTVEYHFNSAGERKVFFCASRDAGETMGLDCEMNILIK